ncbi:hypothetical protein JOE21_002269 [Desmospora profundinema]|uniref:Uncharacterized protein n=1 Tax=Desmospora profundinema TaxID=1571184 RepID=A0ABU1IPD6_9BACL|nr:hypothetical protein [Desmospora profundinema]
MAAILCTHRVQVSPESLCSWSRYALFARDRRQPTSPTNPRSYTLFVQMQL